MDRVFECPGDQLPAQVDRQESRRGVDVLVTSHGGRRRRGRSNNHQSAAPTTHLNDKSLALISASCHLFLQPQRSLKLTGDRRSCARFDLFAGSLTRALCTPSE